MVRPTLEPLQAARRAEGIFAYLQEVGQWITCVDPLR